MNMQRRPSRLTHKEVEPDRRNGASQGDLLPWADPYIASLLREHERQMRGHGKPGRSRS